MPGSTTSPPSARATTTNARCRSRPAKLAGTSGGEAPPTSRLPIGFPPDVPSRQDLDLHVPAPAAAAQTPVEQAEDLSFELDLSNLDQLAEPGSAPPAVAELPAPTPVDASPMFDRFDDARSADMQTTLSNEEFAALPSAFVDLDLGSPGDAPGLIQNLAAER